MDPAKAPSVPELLQKLSELSQSLRDSTQMVPASTSPENAGHYSKSPPIHSTTDQRSFLSPQRQSQEPPEQPKSSTLNMQDHLLRLQQIMAESRAQAPAQPDHKAHSTEQSRQDVEPAVILDWAPALRHTSRLGAQNPHLEDAIRKLILEHRSHEESWWRERDKLKNAKDLADYDSKVYAAQKAMKNHMSKQLHSLGIPFFELSADKIHKLDGEAPNGKISEDKLLELQKKMIEYLEAIYAP